MTESDRRRGPMAAIWNSPWSQVVLCFYFLWAAGYDKSSFWYWLNYACAVMAGVRFFSMGSKRWGRQ